MKILITGATGFVGSNFAYKFIELGHEINLIIRQESDFWRIEPIKDRVKLHYVDLNNAEDLEKFIFDLKPEIILHFATYGAYQGRQQDVKLTIDTNLLGTINLINACGKTDFKCFINTGSSSEYGAKDEPMKETDILEPNNLYGATKAAAAIYAQFMAKKSDLPIVTMRLFSPYGSFEEGSRLIPSIIKSYLTNIELNIVSSDSVRDFIFMDDAVSAYLKAIEKIDFAKGHIFNIGAGVQYSFKELADTVKKITNSDLEPKYGAIKSNQYEPKMWVADISKAKKMLGWEPKFSLEDGLKKDIEWFNKNLALYNQKDAK